MFKFRVLLIASLLVSTLGWAQENKAKDYFANGKPIGKVYANLNSGLNQNNNPSGYEVKRVYLGYQFDLGDGFSTKLLLDIGSPNDVSEFTLKRRFAYFKNAYLQYKKGKFSVQFGVIPGRQFKVQEGIWGHRYVFKTVMDKHSLGSSADLGATLFYKPAKFISFDVGLLNGEGYAKIQNDNSYKFAVGSTIKPIKGLTLRFYGDFIQKAETQINWVNFISYNFNDKVIAGLEYNTQYNVENVKDEDINTISGYLSYNFTKKWQLFGRYDLVESNTLSEELTPWNLNQDGNRMIGGVQYQIHKKVKLALDYQVWTPRDTDFDNEQFIYFHVEFKI